MSPEDRACEALRLAGSLLQRLLLDVKETCPDDPDAQLQILTGTIALLLHRAYFHLPVPNPERWLSEVVRMAVRP